jgi:predicted nucleic acid-binding protein
MTSSSTNLVYEDAAGWIALVNRRDALHTEAVRIYKQLLQEQGQFITASVVLLEVGNWLSPTPLRGLAIDLLHRIEQSGAN